MHPQVLLVFLTRYEECQSMLKGISRFQQTHGPWSAFLDDEARAEQDHRWLSRKPWQGVISRHVSPGFAAACAARRLPLVDLNDTPPIQGVPKIRPDNAALGHLGAEHFLDRGHRRFGFCGFRNEAWACERRDGFVDALRLAGHTCALLDVDYPGDLTPSWDARQTAVLAAWIRQLPRPVALMACNDLRALQVVAAAQQAGLLVPEEVAVLGCNNDTNRCDLSYPPLSSVATDPHESGRLAAESLARLIAGERVAALPAEQRVEPLGVVTRRSSDISAIEDRAVAAAVSHIREHACHGLTVDQLLRPAAASRSQLERRFRSVLGRSPQAEIRRVQVARIRQLLAETDLPMKRIAELAGFRHVEYMCVLFKRLTGLSPGTYRRRHTPPAPRSPANTQTFRS